MYELVGKAEIPQIGLIPKHWQAYPICVGFYDLLGVKMYVQVRDNDGDIYGLLEIPDGKLSEFLKCETVGDLPSWYGQDH